VGTVTITMTVTDTSGNVSSCTATITVSDTTAPVTSTVCPIPQSLTTLGENDCDRIFYWTEPTFTDACTTTPTVVRTLTPTSPVGPPTGYIPGQFVESEVGVGITTVSYVATDASGNSTTCSFTLTLTDNSIPVITCPASVTVSNDFDDCGAQVTVSATATDNCTTPVWPIIVYSYNGQTVSSTTNYFPVGTTQVTATAVDQSFNTVSCNFTVTVSDTQAPVPVCTSTAIYVTLDGNGNGTLVTSTVGGSSSDNCAITSSSISQSSFTCSDVGSKNITLTVTDAAGNSATCQKIITVSDTTAPVAVCTSTVTVTLDGMGSGTLATVDVNNGSTDNCTSAGNLQFNLSKTAFMCGDLAQTVTLTVTDAYGNSSTCPVNVIISEPIAPVALCKDITVSLDASGNGSTTTSTVDNGSSDNCGIAQWGLSQSAFTCTDIPSVMITMTVTDTAGNVSSCTSVVTVNDNINPVVTCTSAAVNAVLDGTGNASIAIVDIVLSSGDNCSVTNTVLSITAFTCTDLGTQTVTATVTDGSGNTGTCSRTITVTDTTAPVAVCKDVTVTLDASGSGSTTTDTVNNNSSDNCSIAYWGLSQSTFGCIDIPSVLITMTVTDTAGNVSSCTSLVTVTDTTPPVVTCTTTEIALTLVTSTVVLPVASTYTYANDVCSGTPTLSLSKSLFDCLDTSMNPHTVTLTATDSFGNSTSCSVQVRVTETTDPYCGTPGRGAALPTVSLSITSGSTVELTTSTVDMADGDAAWDNCGIVTYTLTGYNHTNTSTITFDCAAIGTNHTVTLTITDGSGNSADCEVLVTVSDTVDPVAMCKDISVSLATSGSAFTTTSTVDNGTSDNCSIVSWDLSKSVFTCTDMPSVVITMTVTDTNGNVSSCTAIVTVSDTINPVVTCTTASVVLSLDGTGNVTVTVGQIVLSSADNCTVTNTVLSRTSFTCSDIGMQTVTATVTDQSGNTHTCSREVTVTDTTAPTAQCTSTTVVLPLSADTWAGTVTLTTAQAHGNSTDNCTQAGDFTLTLSRTTFGCADLGLQTVTLTVADESGNTDTCTATVSVTDTTAPLAGCLPYTVSLDGTGSGTVSVTDIEDVANTTDNCSIVSRVLSRTTFGCADLGENTVTFTVMDQSGNTHSCDATVTVTETIAPSFAGTCPLPQVQDQTADNDCDALFYWVEPTFTDNCGFTVSRSTDPAYAIYPPATGYVAGQNVQAEVRVGVTTVSYVATDAAGNKATCSFTLTLNDLVLPVITCPTVSATYNNDLNQCHKVITLVATATDNCQSPGPPAYPVITYTFGGATVSTTTHAYPVGSTVVTATATDYSGNIATCSYTVIVNDTEAPRLVGSQYDNSASPVDDCKANALTAAPFNALDAITGYVDNCTVTPTATVVGVGTVTGTDCEWYVTYTFDIADQYGNVLNGQTYTIEGGDVSAPQLLTTATNTTFECGPNVQALVGAYILNNGGATVTETCSDVIWSNSGSITSDLCGLTGDYTVVFVATDGCGNTVSTTGVVTVTDTTAPTVSDTAGAQALGGDQGNKCIANAPSAPSVAVISALYVDCEITTVTSTLTSSTVTGTDCSWTATYTYDVSDECGNVTVHTVTYTGGDTGVPTVSNTAGLAVLSGAQGNLCLANAPAAPLVSVVNAMYDDNCGGLTTTLVTSTTTGDDCSWTIVYEYRTTDACSNSATAFVTHTGGDTSAPTVSDTAGALALGGSSGNLCKAAATPAPSVAVISALYGDNCGGVTSTLTSSDVTGTDCSWTATYVYTVGDACNNTSVHTVTYTGGDTGAPTIANASDLAALSGPQGNLCLANAPSAPGVDVVSSMYTDNCGGVTSTLVTSTTTGNDCSWTVVYEYSISDACSNSTTTLVTHTGGDTGSPSFAEAPGALNATVYLPTTCPSALTTGAFVYTGSVTNTLQIYDGATLVTTLTAPVDTDICDMAPVLTLGVVLGAYDNCSTVTATLSWTSTDVCGNQVTYTQLITLIDDKNPVAGCAAATVTLNGSGTYTLLQTEIDAIGATSTDNCSGTPLKYSIDNAVFDCTESNTGVGGNNIVTRVLTVTDCALNTATCTVSVTILPLDPDAVNVSPSDVCSEQNGLGGAYTLSLQDYIINSVTSTFSWTANYGAVTGGAYSGTVSSSTVTESGLQNKTPNNIDVIYTVVPANAATTCTGTTFTVSQTVYPEPVGQNQEFWVCHESSLNYIVDNFLTNKPTEGREWIISYTNDIFVEGEYLDGGVSTTTTWGNHNVTATTVVNNSTQIRTLVYTITPRSLVNGCEGDAFTVTIHVLPEVTADVQPNGDLTLCVGETRNVNSAPAVPEGDYVYEWTVSNPAIGQLVGSVSGTTVVLEGVGAGLVTITLNVYEVNDGCLAATDSETFTINANPAATADSNDADDTICEGQSVTLTAGGGGTYVWNDPTGSTSSTVVVSPAVTTTYVVTVTNAAGCSSTASVQITVNEVPEAPETEGDCVWSGSAVANLVAECAEVGCTISWYTTLTGGTSIGTSLSGANFNPLTGPAVPGTYTYYAECNLGGCASPRTITTLTVTAQSGVAILAAGPFCESAAPVTLVGSPAGGVWSGVGITNGALGTFDPGVVPISGSNTSTSTVITYTYADGSGCDGIATTSITITTDDAPIITGCPSNQDKIASALSCLYTPNWTAPSASDDCQLVSFTNNVQTSYTIGTYSVVYTATDGGGNTASCSFTLTVVDQTAPSIFGCPTNVTLDTNTDLCSQAYSWNSPATQDNCGLFSWSVSYTTDNTFNPIPSQVPVGGPLASPLSLPTTQTFYVGRTIVTYLATDASGNTSTCQFRVTITENDKPSFADPSDQSLSTEALSSCPEVVTVTGVSVGVVSYGASYTVGNVSFTAPNFGVYNSTTPGVFGDACDTDPVLTLESIGYNLARCTSVVTLVWKVTDDFGNFRTNNQVFTIVDNTAPSLTGSAYTLTNVSSCVATATSTAPFSAANAVTGYTDN
jgi:hypothetical protein